MPPCAFNLSDQATPIEKEKTLFCILINLLSSALELPEDMGDEPSELPLSGIVR